MASARGLLLMVWCPLGARSSSCSSCSWCSRSCARTLGARARNFGCGGDCSISANGAEGGKSEDYAGGQGERAHQNVGYREDHVGGGGLLSLYFLDYRPVGGDAEQKLGADEGREEDAPAAKVRDCAEADAYGAARPDGEEQDDECADDVREDLECAVAEACAQDQLHEYGGCGDG